MKTKIYFIYDKVANRYINVLNMDNHETFKRSFSSHLLSLLNNPDLVHSIRIMNDCDVYYFEFDNGLPVQEKMEFLLHVKDLIKDLKSKNGNNLDKVDK